ncbi:HIR complex subunit [Recurvomyces mirabilis]|uniref:Protein HIR n=1 Tax=Recurvomyces mirabilis TaxID=574656 RepID=A0AAE0TP50_9PEZI|nr:HIR complex subunit [Recurvomyces mirabilis]KAK5159760.1 HIR complex subunit [Recurvomyces mirabilis]
MRFTKPLWLTHGGEKRDADIYSCHVSPDGSRLATGAGDGHVRIWSTDAILNASNPAYTKPKQLASLSYHSGTVHSVRFSSNGKYLASGADDKILCVYSLEAGAVQHTTFGSKETPPTENWRIFRRLIGHDNDVQDLGWSADSSILVSVGLDSKVVIWSGSTFEKLKTLANHQSHVKGITFDPANKYFATASDDRSIKIYRFTSPPPNATAYDQTSNFTLEATVNAPFATSPLTTYFRRCSWSPEGAHIAAANATNGPVSSVAIINRGSWDSEINLIGHEGPVEVCAFSPRLFLSQPPPPPSVDPKSVPPQPPAVSVVACAGQDKTISVWNTSFPRPFVTTAELCAKPISDLAWSPDGETLYCTSLDGTIAALIFEKGELGYPSEQSDNEQRLAKYGAGRRAGIVEGADALRLEEGSKAGELKGVEGRMGELMGDPESATTGALTNGESATHINGTSTALAVINGATNESTPAPQPPKDPQQDKIDKMKNRVTFTKEGKKRIAPLLVSSSNQGEANLPRPQLQASMRQGGLSDEPAGKTLDLSKPYDGLPKGGLASLLIGNKRKYAEVAGDDDDERKQAERRVQAVQQSGGLPIVNNTADGLVPASSATAKKNPSDIPEVLRPAVVNPSLTVSQVRLAVPAIRGTILRPLDGTKLAEEQQTNGVASDMQDSDTNVIFEARNATGPSRTGRVQDKEPTRITLSRRNQTLWQDFIPRAVLLTTGNRNFWAAACEDGSVHLWTPAGRRLAASMVLEAQPVILDCRGWWLLAITAAGQAYVWNIKDMSAAHPPVSLAPALDAASATMSMQGHLTAAPSLMFARLNSQGRIVLGMSNGDGFAYNPSMYVWQRLSESWWAVGSQYWNTTDTSVTSAARPGKTSSSEPNYLDDINPENISAGIIPLLERNTTSQALLKGRAYFLQRLVKQLLSAEGFEGFESSVSIAHLEHRVVAAMILSARDEFRVYLIMYAKRLGAEGLRSKVEELLKGLMGQIYDDEDADEGERSDAGVLWGEGEEIVGWNREGLLKEVVMALGKHRDLQRVTVPYARLLGILDDLGGQAGADVAMITDV